MKKYHEKFRQRPPKKFVARSAASLGVMICLALSANLAMAAEARGAAQLRVAAPIVAVEAITTGGAAICDIAPPERRDGLAATLRWDLYGRCRPADAAAEVTGYRVTYEWDGRRFETVRAQAPVGDTLALDLEIY